MVAFRLDQLVEFAGGEFKGTVGGGVDVVSDVRGIFGGEEDDAGWVRYERGLEHEVGESFGVVEVGVRRCGPALAEGLVFDERCVKRTEVAGERAVMDAEGLEWGVGHW